MIIRRIARQLAILAAVTLTAATIAQAVAPTEQAIEKWKAEGVWDRIVQQHRAFIAAGGNAPEEHSPFVKRTADERLALGARVMQTIRVPVILVDFLDNEYTAGAVAGTAAMFDSLLFSDPDSDLVVINPSGSMTEYYLENSYGQMYIEGTVVGWYRMPQTYAWYENGNGGIGNGITGRANILARDAVDAAENDGLDFSQFDNNNDFICDGVIIVHAGCGAEESTCPNAIWSHKWTLSETRTYDGVSISAYTMNPEESLGGFVSIGVFCHEYGHILGLPDLYDVADPARNGVGRWSLMANGNWLGAGRKPAHLDAWSKSDVGFINLVDVSANMVNVDIPAVEFDPIAYKLSNATSGSEYWVVENRRRQGFDIQLPGQGLCIYHVDDAASFNNENPARYHVAVEQADGLNTLADSGGNAGDGGDLWPGATNAREFHNLTTPNTRTNVFEIPTKIAVWDISNDDSVITADFDVTDYSRPYIQLVDPNSIVVDDNTANGDGDGIFEPNETVQVFCTVTNLMRTVYNPTLSLSTDNPAVTVLTNNVLLGATFLTGGTLDNAAEPLEFQLASEFISVIDTFYLTITADSVSGRAGGEFTKVFPFEIQLGAALVLIVDDDRGENYEVALEEIFYNLRVPTKTWEKQTQGSPSGVDLAPYSIVFWHTGAEGSNILDSNDIAAMKAFADNSGDLCLSTMSGIIDLHNLDSAFMHDYFGARYVSEGFGFSYWGIDGNPVGESTSYRYDISTYPPFTSVSYLTPVDGGQAAFIFGTNNPNPTSDVAGISYIGAAKSILLAFPMEFLADDVPGFDDRTMLVRRALEFFGGIATSVYDGDPYVPLPVSFELHQNYPNPFNPSTNISYTLRATGAADTRTSRSVLSIYNLLGQHVVTLVDRIQVPGTYVIEWDGTDQLGREVASGVYFYRLKRGEEIQARKMMLVR